MSSGLIILIIVIIVLIILACSGAVLVRKSNDNLLKKLENKKEELYNLPVNDEVDKIKSMHLIGQSQVAFREWNQKWVDLSLNSFADLENNLFEAEAYNQSFRFLKAKHAIDSIESQIQLVEEDISVIREALQNLENQEDKNSGRVLHALELFEGLQVSIAENTDQYGIALTEFEKQLQHIESEFSKFVTLNSSGDPVEAAEILDQMEDHILALTHIADKMPAVVEKLTKDLPDQLEDLELGYHKLLDADYHFEETDIESRFQGLRDSIEHNSKNISALELDNAQYENSQMQEEVDTLYNIFTREIKARKVVEKMIKELPAYIDHIKENNQQLLKEIDRLERVYLLADHREKQVRKVQSDINAISIVVSDRLQDIPTTENIYSGVKDELEDYFDRIQKIEDEQIMLGEQLIQIEKNEANARHKVNIYVNKLHTIKRYMEKRNLPGIPNDFLRSFFTASNNLEDLMHKLEQPRINIESVIRLLEVVDSDIAEVEGKARRTVQNATLAEQLLQYSNRYRSFDDGVQDAFNRSLAIFEQQYDYSAAFKEISGALESIEPGVTDRFVGSYEKTCESVRF